MRALWKVALVFAPLIITVVILSAVVSPLVPDPLAAVQRRLNQLGGAWPLMYFPPSPAWSMLAVALVAMVVLYVALRLREAYLARLRPLDDDSPTTASSSDLRVSYTSARTFIDAILAPQRRFLRITESVEPYTRSLNVRTTLTVELADVPVGQNLVLPVILSERGRLENRISFTDEGGTRISSLNRASTNQFMYGAIRALIWRAGPIVWLAFRRPRDGGSISSRVRIFVDQIGARGNQPIDEEGVTELITDILGLPRTRFDSGVLDIAAVLWELRLDYPICLTLVRRSAAVRSTRITVQRRVIPEVQSSRPSSRDVDPGLIRSISRITRITNSINRWSNSVLDWVRQSAGVTSSVISHDIGNAARSQSYHLEIAGPAGYYAARQQIVDALGLPVTSRDSIGATSVQHSALRGQRHTHLYLRSAGAARGSSFRAVFHERTPGSMAIALSAAFATFVVSAILAITQTTSAATACEADLNGPVGEYERMLRECMTTTASVTGSSDTLLQILLTLPIAILAMPLVRNSSVWGGVLVARVTNITIIALALLALVLSALASAFSPAGLAVAWIVILGMLFTVVASAFVSWVQRVWVHVSYVRSQTE